MGEVWFFIKKLFAVISIILGTGLFIWSLLFVYGIFYGGYFEAMLPFQDHGADLSFMNWPFILISYSFSFFLIQAGFERIITKEHCKIYWKIKKGLYLGCFCFLILISYLVSFLWFRFEISQVISIPAIRQDNVELVKKEEARGIDTNRSINGWTPLMFAARLNAKDVANYLIQQGANIEARNEALKIAIGSNNIEMAKLLIERGADVNATGHYGESSLFTATETGNFQMVKLIVEHGANVNAKNYYGLPVLHFAYNSDIKSYLEQHGAR